MTVGEHNPLQPAFAFKEHKDTQRNQRHYSENYKITVFRMQFRHKFEIHTVNTRDKGRRQEEHRHHREDFGTCVLV